MQPDERNGAPALDEIVARVQAEAARRAGAPSPAARPDWEAISRRAGLAAAALAGHCAPPAPDVSFPVRKDRRYAMSDFLAHHGSAFVTACYRGALGREPDAAGHRHYLDRLLEGAPRAEILARLRYSAEGRAYAARIDGLAPRAALAALSRLPLAGPVVEWLAALALAGRNARALRALEARHAVDAGLGAAPSRSGPR